MGNEPIKKSSFKRIIDSNIFWMIVSLVAAIVLWLYVTGTEGVEVTKNINGITVEFTGADTLRDSSSLIITEQDTATVNITVRGTRRTINKLNASNVVAYVDLTNVKSDGRYMMPLQYSFPSGVSESDVTVEKTTAETVNFYVDRIISKVVEVKGDFIGTTADGYLSDETLIFDPVSVKISGPKTELDQVQNAYISLTRDNVDRTISYASTYNLVNADGETVPDTNITRETETVNVTMTVRAIKTVPLDVTLIDGAGAVRGENVSITISPSSVQLAGDAEVIAATTKIVLGTIDLSSFTNEYNTTFTIIPPNDTENMTGVTEAAVTITVTGLASQTYTVPADNISCINVPDGYDVDVITKSLSVVVRGPEESIAKLENVNIRAVADLSELSNVANGVFIPGVHIYIDGYPDVGVIGEYKIYIQLEEVNG